MSKKDEIQKILESVPGMLDYGVAEFLYEMSSKCSRSAIVEIGGYYGRSTICLAKGSKSGGHMPIYSIDPCSGLGTTPDPTWSDSYDPGTPDPKYYVDVGTTFSEVRKQFKKFQVDDIITSIVNYSEPAYKQGWDIPIELLFIDGDHRYNYAKMDLEMWGKHVISGGTIIMHDHDHPGTKRVIDEMIINNPRYTNIKTVPLFHVTVL